MTRLKKIGIHLCGLMIVCCLFFIFGCSKTQKGAMSVEGYEDEVVFEYMTDVLVPPVVLNGISAGQNPYAGVEYQFTSPEYEENGETKTDVYKSHFPALYCNRVGTWTVDYIYKEETITKKFEVKDTIAPTLKMMSRPYDVWASEDKQNLPAIDTTDASGLDFASMVKTVTLNGEKISVDALDRYVANTTGELKYALSIKDIYGNESTIETKWNVKDQSWKDTKLANGYLADFDSPEYVNCAESGYASSYWSNTQVYEEYLEEFKGEKGVLKLTAPANSKANGAFKIRLSKPTTAADLAKDNKYIVIMMYTSQTNVRIACDKWSDKAESAHNFAIEVKPNCWNKIVLSTADLKEGYDDRGTNISQIQFCFGDRNNLIVDDIDLYLASITTADYLPTITDVENTNNVVTWNAVKDADGYEVIENNKTQTVSTNKYTCKKKNSIIAVRAIADESNVLKLSSEVKTPYIDKSKLGDDYIATMNSPAYTYLFRLNDFSAARRGVSLKAEYLSEYKGEKGVIKVTTVNNNLTAAIGDMVMDLMGEYPEGITVRYMVGKSDAKYLRYLQPHTEYGVENVGDMKAGNSWQTVYLNYGKNYKKDKASDRMDVMVQGGTKGATNEIYFAFIKKGNCLSELLEQQRAPIVEKLKKELEGKMLADYDSNLYTEFVEKVDPSYVYGTFDTEWLESYQGEKGVLKVTLTTDDFASKDAAVKLKLLGDMADGFTIKYRWESATGTEAKAARWRLLKDDNTLSGKGEAVFNQTFNTWVTETVELSSLVKQKDAIGFYVLGSAPNTTYTLYISYIENYVK